jgi:hypothetical protein
MKGKKGHKTKWFILAAILLSGCSGDDAPNSTNNNNDKDSEIRLNADVWRVMEGTRATTFDNQAAIQEECYFTCTMYDANTITVHYPATQVDWNSTNWAFHNVTYRWPNSGSLDFFAYMPATKPDYITSISYTTARNPQFICTELPMTSAGQSSSLKEFIYALTLNQDKENPGNNGVTMTFKHPFARIKFQLSANHPDVHINTITFKDLKTGGNCSFDGNVSTWSSLTPAELTDNFVATHNADFKDNPNNVVPLGDPYIMVPQSWAGEIEVNITWDDWGTPKTETLSTTVPTTWQSGYSYTYTFTISKYALIVNIEKFTEQW